MRATTPTACSHLFTSVAKNIGANAAELISPLDRVSGAIMRFVRETSRAPHVNDAR